MIVNLIGVTNLVYLTISLFIEALSEPISCVLSHAIFQLVEPIEENFAVWAIIIFKVTGFMTAFCFVVLGTNIAYYKTVIKVDTMRKVNKTSLYCLLGFAIANTVHVGIVIVFSALETFSGSSDKILAAQVVAILIQLMISSGALFFFVVLYKKTGECLKTMLEFHDYLIQYRLTPRSRILRKHLPRMTMVLEEDSNMDASSMMLSQSRVMSNSLAQMSTSIRHTHTNKKRFVYREENNSETGLGLELDVEDGEDDSSESDDDNSQNEEDLERDLMVLD